MTSTDTLLPCPFCGGDARLHDNKQELCVLCYGCEMEVFGNTADECVAAWNRRTPPTPATEEREAVARALCIAGEEDDFNYKGYLELADAALSTLAPIRAAEILAAEARGYAKAIEDAANEATQLWEYGIPSQEFPRRIRAIEHGEGK